MLYISLYSEIIINLDFLFNEGIDFRQRYLFYK